jgi:hypothetical protein
MMNDRDEYGYGSGSTAGQVMAGVVVGAAIGATLGLILAPRSGRETRRILSESGDKIRRQASDAYQQATSSVNEMVNRGRDAVSRGRGSGRCVGDLLPTLLLASAISPRHTVRVPRRAAPS